MRKAEVAAPAAGLLSRNCGGEGVAISTRDLSALPDVEGLRRTLQSMAMLDAILCPEWEFRYYSFNAAWAAGEQMGSMRNGSGDEFYAHFGAAGCWLKGFAHEYPFSPYRDDGSVEVWPGVLDSVPAEFAACLREPAFDVGNATFCVWRRYGDRNWQVGPVEFPTGHPDPDGSESLLWPLDGRPKTYRDWASDYYERDVSLAAVEHVYRHRPLTPAVVAQLNPDVSLTDLSDDVNEIGYPSEPLPLPGGRGSCDS
jgi:hypothetical protein